jgi:hypothetical protein
MIIRRALLSTVLIACGGSDAANAPPTSPTPSAVTAPDPLASSAANDPTVPKPKAHPASDKVTWKEDSPPKQCHSTRAAGDLATAMAAMVSSCIDVKAMHRVGQSHAGEGREGDHKSDPMVTRIPLEAKANHCYRVFGLADPAVKDFDVAVTDSAGKSAGEDLTDSNDAIVLEAGSICFKQDDAASVNAAVTKGGGKWIVEIWSD